MEQPRQEAQYGAFARAALAKQNGGFTLSCREVDVKMKGVEVDVKICC
jgi:hypothetical protein